MARSNPAWDPLFARLGTLKATWPARAWSWDSRFTCITSSFTVEFNSTTLSRASSDIRRLAERTGGLRSGQMLLTADDCPGLVAFGLWWPWGDGATTSFRVGFSDLEWNDDPYPRVREIFNVLTG